MKKLFIANWKMNLGFQESLSLEKKYKSLSNKNYKLIVAPGFPMITEIKKQTSFDISAQNCAAWDKGSYTGEVSCQTLKELGAKYVIVGHSERKKYLNETDALINAKIKQAWKTNLTPIVCFGEDKSQVKRRGQVIAKQISNALKNLKPNANNKLIIAYEPIWAIGTGKNCSADIVVDVYKMAENVLSKQFGKKFFKTKVKFIYGGSVNPKNISAYLAKKEIHGFLVGKTSLDIKKLKNIF